MEEEKNGKKRDYARNSCNCSSGRRRRTFDVVELSDKKIKGNSLCCRTSTFDMGSLLDI